jgi:cyclohexanone monooxygenase
MSSTPDALPPRQQASHNPKTSVPVPFDRDAMRERYRLEREKRIRSDGNDQYVEVAGDFAHFVNDPYIAETIERAPLEDEVEVLLIGGGFGGLQAGARLREAGVQDIRIVEKGGDFGGTWYWNRYPGAQCDIESYIYLPLLEELCTIPTEKYAQAKEILAHSQAIGRHYDLYDGALFQTEVTGMKWEEADARWVVSTNKGDRLRARFVAMANGPMHRPKLPGIPGLQDFKGHSFHTSRWDYQYTGGSPGNPLSRLTEKRVAVIGTGATAIQCVPHLGATAKHLYVFQRTPSSVDVRGNTPTHPEWAKRLEAGWHKHRMENFNGLVSGVPQPEDLVDDGWTDLIGKSMRLFREARNDKSENAPAVGEILEAANFEKMNEIRERVATLVEDPGVAEQLKPYYQMFCKRPCFNDEYLPTFNRPNVDLVDTNGRGVEQITERGLIAEGKEYEVDCIIFATGFEVGTGYARRAGYEVVGRDGQTLTDYWADGVKTFHGLQSHGFPNCFIMSATQGGFTANYPHLLEETSTHIAHLIGHAISKGFTTIEPTLEAENAWVQTILRKATSGMGGLGGKNCTPGYYNNEGQDNPRAAQASSYGGGSIRFFKMLADWREAGDFEGIEFGEG